MATSILKKDAILTTLRVNATTASTSTTTGAAIISGGLGVAGTVTATTLSGAVTASSIQIDDSGSLFNLILASNSSPALTANRTLTFDVNDAARTIDITGNLTLAANFITSGANSLTLTTTGATNVTLPTTGTLATLAGTETLSAKTVAATGMAGATATSFVGIVFDAAGEAITDNVAVSNATYYTSITTTGAAAGALANGTMVGQLKLIRMIVDAGDYVLTPVSLSGGTTITFNDALDEVELMWNGTAWRIIKNVGATVA